VEAKQAGKDNDIDSVKIDVILRLRIEKNCFPVGWWLLEGAVIKYLVAAMFVLTSVPSAISGPSDGLALATWNIQTLATPGRKVFDSSAERKPQDYDDLHVVEHSLKADVYALQEISSPAAAAFGLSACRVHHLHEQAMAG
jgi:hypothetical protein